MIHLIGDFSSLHFFLSRGLAQIGVDSTLWSSGDGWKNIPIDRRIGGGGNFFVRSFHQVSGSIEMRNAIRETDALFLATPYLFNRHVNYILQRFAILKSRNLVLQLAGCDHFFHEIFKESQLCRQCLRIDIGSSQCPFSRESWPNVEEIFKHARAYVPWASSYAEEGRVLQSKFNKPVLPTLRFPIDFSYLESIKKPVHLPKKNKIRVLHGISREGMKGTRVIIDAMKLLEDRRSDIEFVVVKRLPFDEYLSLLGTVDLVFDQLWGFGYGMNGAIALSFGAHVIYGSDLGQSSVDAEVIRMDSDAPVFQARKTENSVLLAEELDTIINSYLKIKNPRKVAIEYARGVHDAKLIANQFLKNVS